MNNLLPQSISALAVLGSLIALVMLNPKKKNAAEGDRTLLRGAVGIGWLGLLGGALLIYLGVFNTLSALMGTAACAGLAALPMTIDLRKSPSYAVALGAVAPLLIGATALVLKIDIVGEPADAMLLYAGQWAAFCAAMSAALIASAFSWASRSSAGQGDAASEARAQDARRLGLHARDFALRAVLLGWLSWLVLILIHWRSIGAISMASPADWTFVGALMLATSALLVLWSKRRAYYEAILLIYIAILALGICFGAPFGLAI
ncbi:hypothetical protein [Bradymonas sediminis]|uniref:Uncharacterized protein n=1 Tax=Bradymonas sediminis TaxID=1548548 RepID=A0A2Z4FK09_9DELT|nr:hypothetical protein [Bradymonas sediminis]AWV89210.1 hypothetical protein DN745_07595 [Bradymonas sediminis]TDP73378.1 hypothetical protein DFR33_10617 [Bradymonas sediminis]